MDAVLEGSVERVGARVRITVELIQGSTDEHLWGKSYDRDLRDVLAVQNEIARSIAEELELKLTSVERDVLSHLIQ